MQVSSTRFDPIVLWAILKQIEKGIQETQTSISIDDAVRTYSGCPPAIDAEIRSAIEIGIAQGELLCLEKSPRGDSILESSGRVRTEFAPAKSPLIVISVPELLELGLGRTKARYEILETREAFRLVFSEARTVIRISSPFLESNILNADAFPDLKDEMLFAFERGVKVRILTRLNNSERRNQINWLLDFAKDNNFQDRLEVYSYHIERPTRGIWSSVHAKLVIADSSLAYIGSAEFRRNSLAHNFEAGCIVYGNCVQGLSEAFDLMTRYSQRIK